MTANLVILHLLQYSWEKCEAKKLKQALYAVVREKR